jgi:hypothetical protein
MIRRFLLQALSFVLSVLCGSFALAQTYDSPPVAQPSMAINLSGVPDWNTAHPFINIAKTARSWEGHLPGQWAGISNEELRERGFVDEAGWPLAIPPEANFLATLLLTGQNPDTHSIQGKYRITYSGTAKIKIAMTGRVISIEPNEVWFEFRRGSTGPVMLQISEMDPNDPLRDLEIIHEDLIAAYEVGEIFNPNYIERIKDFRVLRFMDWMHTNNSKISTWSELPQTSDFTYAEGVPLDVMLALANKIGADPWFTLPHLSDDDLVQRFAEQVKRDLKPALKAYFEFSNEFWHGGFEQGRWADRQAEALWGRRAGWDGYLQYAGLRAAQVAAIASDIFDGRDRDRLINVLSVSVHNIEGAKAQLEGNLMRRDLPRPGNELFDAWAVTGYLNLYFGDGETIPTVNRWMSEGDADYVFDRLAERLRQGALKALLEEKWPAHAEYTQEKGLDMIMYEGGTHVILPYNEPNDETVVNPLNDFNFSPQMEALYIDLMAGWKNAGGRLFNAFGDIGTPSRFGAWSSLRHLDDDTGRWNILLAANRRADDYDRDRAPSAFLHGTTILSSSAATLTGTAHDDLLIGSDADEVFTPGPGQDRVNGQGGFDQLLLPARFKDVRFSRGDGLIKATHPGGSVTFKNIDYVFFEGDNFALATQDILPVN